MGIPYVKTDASTDDGSVVFCFGLPKFDLSFIRTVRLRWHAPHAAVCLSVSVFFSSVWRERCKGKILIDHGLPLLVGSPKHPCSSVSSRHILICNIWQYYLTLPPTFLVTLVSPSSPLHALSIESLEHYKHFDVIHQKQWKSLNKMRFNFIG